VRIPIRRTDGNAEPPRGTSSEALLREATLQPNADCDPLRVYLAGLAPGSRRAMKQALEQVARIASGGNLGAEYLPWSRFRYVHAHAVRTALRETISARTGKPLSVASVNKHLSALRGILREAWRLGMMNAEDFHRAVDLEPVRGNSLPRGRALEDNEIAALFHICQRDQSARGPRDATVIALGLYGLRRSEIASAQFDALDRDTWVLRVEGKGSKLRDVPLKNGGADAVRAWVEHRGDRPGALLYPVRKGGRVEVGKISPEAIYRICARRAAEAGVRAFAPHDLRRSFVSALLDRGVDLAIVAKLTGHAGLDTVARYDRRDERAKHAAAETITLPYVFKE
jgi:integrase